MHGDFVPRMRSDRVLVAKSGQINFGQQGCIALKDAWNWVDLG